MPHILIVDDEPDMRLAIRNVLKRRGYEISEAGDGTAALELAGKSRPDLVLLDMRLPGTDLAELMDGFKRLDGSIPVVLVMGYARSRSEAELLSLGASEYLQKPFENAQLVAVAEKFTRSGGEPPLPPAAAPGPAPASVPSGPQSAPPSSAAARPPEPPASARSPVPRRGRFILPVLAGLLLAGLALYRKSAADSAGYYREYPVAAANISALVWAGGELFAGDWLAREVNVYSPDKNGLRLKESYSLERTHISGLAVAGDTLYVADSWKGTIDARRLAPGLPLLKSFQAPGKVSAIFYDGEYLWICDGDGNARLRRPDPGLTPSVSFELREKPDQIFKDKNYLWTVVSSAGKLYRYKLDDGLTPAGVFSLKTPKPGFPVSAFAWRGGRLWLARDGLAVISESGSGELVKE